MTCPPATRLPRFSAGAEFKGTEINREGACDVGHSERDGRDPHAQSDCSQILYYIIDIATLEMGITKNLKPR